MDPYLDKDKLADSAVLRTHVTDNVSSSDEELAQESDSD